MATNHSLPDGSTIVIPGFYGDPTRKARIAKLLQRKRVVHRIYGSGRIMHCDDARGLMTVIFDGTLDNTNVREVHWTQLVSELLNYNKVWQTVNE